jgi:hypothetical protein
MDDDSQQRWRAYGAPLEVRLRNAIAGSALDSGQVRQDVLIAPEGRRLETADGGQTFGLIRRRRVPLAADCRTVGRLRVCVLEIPIQID